MHSHSFDRDSLCLQLCPQRRKLRGVVFPSVERRLVQRLAHLDRTLGVHGCGIALKLQATRLEGEPEIIEQRLGRGCERPHDVLIGYVVYAVRQDRAPMRHEPAVTDIKFAYLAEIVGERVRPVEAGLVNR